MEILELLLDGPQSIQIEIPKTAQQSRIPERFRGKPKCEQCRTAKQKCIPTHIYFECRRCYWQGFQCSVRTFAKGTPSQYETLLERSEIERMWRIPTYELSGMTKDEVLLQDFRYNHDGSQISPSSEDFSQGGQETPISDTILQPIEEKDGIRHLSLGITNGQPDTMNWQEAGSMHLAMALNPIPQDMLESIRSYGEAYSKASIPGVLGSDFLGNIALAPSVTSSHPSFKAFKNSLGSRNTIGNLGLEPPSIAIPQSLRSTWGLMSTVYKV